MSLPVPSAHASSSLSWCAKSRPESAGELLEGAERSWGCCGLDAAPTWLSHPTFLSLRHPPCSSGQQCQELIRNLKAAAEPGALALGAGGGTGAWPALGVGGAQPVPVAIGFLGSPPLCCGPQGVAGCSPGRWECLWCSAWLWGLGWAHVPLSPLPEK